VNSRDLRVVVAGDREEFNNNKLCVVRAACIQGGFLLAEGQKKAGFWLATNNGDPFSDFQGDEHWVY
jgi:hypothetical protein